jgi:probable DNA repair protein
LQDLLPLVEMRRRHMESQCLEKYKAGNAPILHPSEKIRGGSSLFSSQAACPFKAFASHRLGLKAQPEPELGLSAADRGSLLHRALELLWKKIETQQNLLALDQEQQQNLCLEISQCAVNEILQRRHGHIGPRFKALEIKRIQQLLDAWLEVERERADFTVLCFEDKKSFNFDSLNLEIRIDRIDQLEDGSLLIIDYKTALCSLSSWWGDRPEEPQLPLYNMLVDSAEKKVSGIAFAQIRVDGCTIKGIGSEQSPEPSVRWQHKIKSEAGVTDWPDLQTHWQKVLTTIARDFISGKADVDPKSPPQTCLYCDLASFCRVNHREVVLA